MSTKETGGPAFPSTEDHGLNSGMPGMTLRDYFAAKAMQADISRVGHYAHKGDPARLAYQMADAMLEARKS
jgi:hypothetical protein